MKIGFVAFPGTPFTSQHHYGIFMRGNEAFSSRLYKPVLVDAQTERILGASLLCIEGDEIVHSLLDVMAADASYRVVQRAVHIHPTVSELIPTLLGQLTPLPPLGADAGGGA